MKERLCWVDEGENRELVDHKTGIRMGHLELHDGRWEFIHLKRMIVGHKDKEEAEKLARETIRGYLTTNDTVRFRLVEIVQSNVDKVS